MSGTTIVAGECYGRVIHTGSNTEIGKAQADVLKDKTVRVVSVFQKKIMTVVQVLVTFSLVLVIAVLLVQGFKYDGFEDDVTNTILDAVRYAVVCTYNLVYLIYCPSFNEANILIHHLPALCPTQ